MLLDKVRFFPSDYKHLMAIRAVHERAFGRCHEADIVEKLLEGDGNAIDLCAALDGLIVAHCLLVEQSGPDRMLAMAPLAVDPEWRDFQIGTEIVKRTIDQARSARWRGIFVQGNPSFFSRFGFERVPNATTDSGEEDVLMVLALQDGALHDVSAKLDYQAIFEQPNAA